jgi:RNA polymerase sigma factor (sigma-70 family)
MEDGPPDVADESSNSEQDLVSKEEQAQVRLVLGRISAKNRQLLSAIFLEERSSAEVCRQFGVDQNYLRVLMFRARAQFRKAMGRE